MKDDDFFSLKEVPCACVCSVCLYKNADHSRCEYGCALKNRDTAYAPRPRQALKAGESIELDGERGPLLCIMVDKAQWKRFQEWESRPETPRALPVWPGPLTMTRDEVIERLCDMLHKVWERFDRTLTSRTTASA